MANITDYLKKILSARYGKDVRQAIHDSILQCYTDGKAGSIDLQARQDIQKLDDMLGEADISEIGDGTVTGAIAAQNSNFSELNRLTLTQIESEYFTSGAINVWCKNNICNISVNAQLIAPLNYSSVIFTIPDSIAPLYWSLAQIVIPGGKTVVASVNPSTREVTYGGDNLNSGDWISFNAVWHV